MALPDYLILQWTTLVDLPVRMHLLPLLKISRTLPGTILVFVHSFLRHSGDTKVTLTTRAQCDRQYYVFPPFSCCAAAWQFDRV
jgi:hypothetical protein